MKSDLKWTKEVEEEVLKYNLVKQVYFNDVNNDVFLNVIEILRKEDIKDIHSRTFQYQKGIDFIVKKINYYFSKDELYVEECVIMFLMKEEKEFIELEKILKNGIKRELLTGELMIHVEDKDVDIFFENNNEIIIDDEYELEKYCLFEKSIDFENLKRYKITGIIYTFTNCDNQSLSTLQNIIYEVKKEIKVSNFAINELMILKARQVPEFLAKNKEDYNLPRVRILVMGERKNDV